MLKSKNSQNPTPSPKIPTGLSLLLLYLQFFIDFIGLLCYAWYSALHFVYRQFQPVEPKSLRNEIILVTGGANGIGRGICLELAKIERNLTLIIWDVDEYGGQSTMEELRLLGVQKVFAFKVDVSDPMEVESVAQKILSEIGPVSILFNNAGVGGPVGNGWDTNVVRGVQKVMDINALSHCRTLQAFLPSMIESGRQGHVIETCSLFSFTHATQTSAYTASKHAVKGYIECVKEDVRNLGGKPKINFTLVYPHHTVTAMTSGVNLRAGKYFFLFPHMTPAFVASKIVEGVRRNEEHVYIPGRVRFFAMILPLLPPQVVRRWAAIVDVRADKTEVD